MKIFIELPTWLGDSVMSSAAITNLALNYPEAKITFFGKASSCELFSTMPNCELIITDNSKNSKLRLAWLFYLAKSLPSFDIALSFRSHFASKFLLFLLNAKQKAIFKYKKNSTHQVEKYLNFLNSSFNLKALNSTLKLHFLPYSYPRPTLGLNPGASYGWAKRWRPEYFAQVASKLSLSYDIVIFGGKGEEEICEKISNILTSQNIAHKNLCAKTSIKELCEHIAGLSLFITNDSGPMHIAAAFEIKTFAIFGPTNFTETSPYSKNAKILHLNLACQPCMRRSCPLKTHECMEKLSPQMLLAEIKNFT